METTTPSPAGRPVGRDRGFSDTFATRPRMFNERDPMRHGSSPAGRENRSPSSVPKGLESMLKTTTETGDIGMFSIKPSRVPQSLHTPRQMGNGLNELRMPKTRQRFQPYGVPVVDDRRRLPSYARDTSSDVLSMYDTASQKSARSTSRAFDDPDYRSYSMTQTSYTSYTISNHRSYASLRSHPDGTGIVQRPRSPFAYPTRLRRPGFRPSSPALTDGGVVDYSRRVEIDRAAYGPSQTTASPSSLYAQRRKPPLSLRPEGNRSTPSLLSQPSPPRRSSSPLVPRPNGVSANDWQRRNVTTSGNTSPARSTLSLASTVNLYATAPITSIPTTPGKLHPPSPLYYDYTEDFEIEVGTQSETFGPPPQFRIEKTIPEDRPMSADGPRSDEAQDEWRGDSNGFQTMTPECTEQPKNGEAETPPNNANNSDLLQQNSGSPSPTAEEEEEGRERTISNGSDASDRKKIVRLSGLGYGARELSCHVEEAFGLPSSSSCVIDVGQGEKEAHDPETEMTSAAGGNSDPDKELHSTRTSSYSLGSQFPQFPSPPGGLEKPQSTGANCTQEEPANYQSKTHVAKQDARRSISDPSDNSPSKRISKESQCLPPPGRPRARSTGFASIDTSLAELAGLIEGTNRSQSGVKEQTSIPSGRTPMASPTIPDKSVLRRVPPEYQRIPSLSSSFNQQRGRELQMLAQRQPLKQNNYRARTVEPPTVATHDAKGVPNFSHQIPPKVIARSESPMLAPKPISPARQLKLKNSIPQLMKALPPVPPEPSHATILPGHPEPKVDEISRQISPRTTDLLSHTHMETPKDKGRKTAPNTEAKLPPLPEDHAEAEGLRLADKETLSMACDQRLAKNSAPKLKLKVKNSVNPRPLSPLGLQPWNLDESYPWSNQTPNVRMPSTLPTDNLTSTRQPKFKIRVTRASDSTQGTIRVTRDTENTENGLDLQNSTDLFTSSSGIDNIFRQFGRHLHSRKASANSSHQSEDSEPMLTPNNPSSYPNESQNADLSALQGPPLSGTSFGVFEARSVFSNDNSQVLGSNSLRKRSTNLRARIAVPYTAKTGAQSYDDITWRDRHGVEVLLPPTNHSDSNLHDIRGIPAVKPKRRFLEKLHRQKLKAKVRGWFKGARLAFTTRVKSRRSRASSVSAGGSGDADKFK